MTVTFTDVQIFQMDTTFPVKRKNKDVWNSKFITQNDKDMLIIIIHFVPGFKKNGGCGCACDTVCACGGQRNFWKSVLPFHLGFLD